MTSSNIHPQRLTFHGYTAEAVPIFLLCGALYLYTAEWTLLPGRVPVARLTHT